MAFVWLLGALIGTPIDAAPFDELEQVFQDKLRAVTPYPDVSLDLNLPKTHPELLSRILRRPLSDFLIVDDELVKAHFEERWNLDRLQLDEYLSVPWFAQRQPDARGGPDHLRLVISSKFTKLGERQGVPTSTFLYDVLLLKSYAALPATLQSPPSAWSMGLCSLVAQDITLPTSLTSCPDLAVETALAALLVHHNEQLLRDAFPAEEKRFDRDGYDVSLKAAIAAVGSDNPDQALQEILRSPEEYHARRQVERKQAEAQEEEDRPAVAPLEPAMQALRLVLPSSEAALRSTVDFVAKNVRQPSLRIILINACYDKLCDLVGQQQAGMAVDSNMFCRLAALGTWKQRGIDADPYLQEFQRRQEEVCRWFEADLQARKQADRPLPTLTYDPAMLKWAIRFLYNYSLPIRQQEKIFRDQLKEKHAGAADWQLDKLLCQELTADIVQEWWRSDPQIQRFLKTVGDPNLDLRESLETAPGKILDCRWTLKREGTAEDEEVLVRILDTFSSGGGAPTPGVSSRAKVVVRKRLDAAPEVVELQQVEPNVYIQSLSSLTMDSPAQREDWARVVTVKRLNSRGPWLLESGAAQPLVIGRKQAIRAHLVNTSQWQWLLPLPLRANEDSLLGIHPEEVIPPGHKAQFPAARVTKSEPMSKGSELTILELSHKEIQEVKESGTAVWGYFAAARFVQALVYPAPDGIEGPAAIEIPDGHKPAESLVAHNNEQAGDKVHAFDYRSPNTFVNEVLNRNPLTVKCCIQVGYTLPDGRKDSLRVTEGQEFVVFDETRRSLEDKKAYQLKLGDELVCGFVQGDRPRTATTTGLALREEALEVHQLTLPTCPLVRANGVLVRVDLEPTLVYPGVDVACAIQLAPAREVIRAASEDQIDLSAAEVRRAGDVSIGALFLSYNAIVPPRRFFWETDVANYKNYVAERYVRIVTPVATLTCGHLQEVYATTGDWRTLGEVQASQLQAGRHHVVWLASAEKAAPWSDAAQAQQDILAAAERAASRTQNKLPAAEPTPAGHVQLVPVLAVHAMCPTASVPLLRLREFIVADTVMARQGVRPTMFANGIMVKVRFESPGPEGEGPGDRGATPQPGKVAEEPHPGPYRPHYEGTIRDYKLPLEKIKFQQQDVDQFQRNRQELDAALQNLQPQVSVVRTEVIDQFLGHYLDGPVEAETVYELDKLRSYCKDYVSPREYLIDSGDPRVLPAVVNGYVFLATLLYEAQLRAAGDALTRDFLCLGTRITARNGGKMIYSSPQFLVRDGLLVTRDLLLYVRDRGPDEAFASVIKVQFPTTSFADVLTGEFVEREQLSPDICAEDQVNLYNLCRQLDKWSNLRGSPLESLVSPELSASRLFASPLFSQRLGIGLSRRTAKPKAGS